MLPVRRPRINRQPRNPQSCHPTPPPAHLRGTAYGLFNLASGVAMLIASVLAGLLWDRLGAAFTFHAGAAFAVVAAVQLIARPGTASRT